jgi:galactokinase
MNPSLSPAGQMSSVDLAARSREVAQRFHELYRQSCMIFRAPGRVNLIGEHTDYNQGFVMPVAIELSCWVAISATADRIIEVHSANLHEGRVFDLDEPRRLGDWSDYVQGVALILERSGYHLPGAKMLVWSDVPMGSGLSSSAALEIATGMALLNTQPAPCDPVQLALACQRAENEYVGARCGIMDQFIASHGRTGHAVMLDCRSLQHRFLPVPPSACLVICNSMVKHQIAAGEYNQRRAQCEEAVHALSTVIPGLSALRDLSLIDLERFRHLLSPTVYRRCRHVITENQRVGEAAAALEQYDLARLGELMAASHRSLRDDYEVSCPELDLLVETAAQTAGVHGARMTGGGFGGCTVNVVSSEAVAGFAEKIALTYRKQTGVTPEIYVSTASAGAGRWEISN